MSPSAQPLTSATTTPSVAEVDDELIALAVEMFAMLADPTRVKIILALAEGGEQSVGALAEAVGKGPTAVSQHLAKFRLARILTTRQEGNRVYYRLANEHVVQLLVDALHQAEHTAGRPQHHRLDP